MSQRSKIIILAVVLILTGFIRDYFFVNINWIYMTLTNDRPNQALDEFHFLLNWTPLQINNLKWVLTFIFTGIYLLLTWLLIKIEFRNKFFLRITLFSYLILVSFALMLYFLSFGLGMTSYLYGVIRTLMGIAQSFMPAMILYILFKFLPQISDNKS